MTGLSGTNPFMVFAGRSASGTATGDMWTTASISGNSWSRSSTSAVSAREGAVAVAWRGSVFFIGGSSSNTLSASYPTTLVAFSSTSASSTQWAAAPWVGRKYHGAVVMNDQLYVFGQCEIVERRAAVAALLRSWWLTIAVFAHGCLLL